LIRELTETEADDGGTGTKQVIGLYELLMDRMLDISSYVRVKVLNTFCKLCDMKAKYPKQRLQITEAAIASLEDKTSSVRKAAIVLLTQLMHTHPYGPILGGFLVLEDFEKGYKKIREDFEGLEAKLQGVPGRDGLGNDDEEDEQRLQDEKYIIPCHSSAANFVQG
jgi:condensin complex subunit 1